MEKILHPFKHTQIFRRLAWLFISIFFVSNVALSQVPQDSITEPVEVEKKKKGSIFSGRPGKSLLMSLVVPGAGQIYNKSYLRVPIVWGAVGGMGWLLRENSRQYICFRDAYVDKIDGNPLTVPHYCEKIPLTYNPTLTISDLENATPAALRESRDQANVNRQWAIIGFTLVWLANGVDAFVDAHLKDFDIDEDLSIDIGPRVEDDQYAPMKLGIFVQF